MLMSDRHIALTGVVIALLSNFGKESIDPPSTAWLGSYSGRERVRTSGLWNNDHVEKQYDPAFLDVLADDHAVLR